MRVKLSISKENHEPQFPNVSFCIGQKSIFCDYCIQNVKDGIKIEVYNINDKCVAPFSQFTSEKVKKNLRKSKAQFPDKLRKLRLRQNYGFLIKKTCSQFEMITFYSIY